MPFLHIPATFFLPCLQPAAKEILAQEAFFWSASTETIINVASDAFRGEFFNAFDQFDAIREADVSLVA